MGGRAKERASLTKVGRSWRTVRPNCLAIDSASDASITNLGCSIFVVGLLGMGARSGSKEKRGSDGDHL